MSLNGRRNGRLLDRFRLWLRWLEPGLGVKRWIALMGAGIFLVSVGAVLIVNFKLLDVLGVAVVRAIDMVYIVTGHVISPIFIGIVLLLLGTGIIVYGMRETIGAIVDVFLPRGDPRLVEMILKQRQLQRGPRIVVLGGGTGLSTLLRGLKKVSTNLTAVVTVFDDGGSSGRLRREQGILPPGDIRNCLVALAEAEPLLTKLFTHRFKGGDLDGHSFGNLFIASMSQVTGDLETAVKECSKVLAIRGRVLPTTLRDVVLCAEMADGAVVEGESAITRAGGAIRRVFLKPARVPALQDVLEAIAEADLIVLGPGSLYTSVLPNLLVDGVVEALRRSPALKVYVCNVMTQQGETRGFRASDHVRVLLEQGGKGLFDYVLVNTRRPRNQALLARYKQEGAEPVEPDVETIRALGLRPVSEDLISEEELVRHDPRKITAVLLQLVASVSPEVRRVGVPL
ncbi:MAG: YvcK family protein [Bacillati bacterium ANGP1]|uniref:Putative gluconeogenesis factor n=1 Tax=Candidatus Segetimicrobium genomatis TaxID=2569760 RepID=A0A537JP92_9BACT|nr:MAG: YvcK family protein [Terrabacteria group bacterium ANGP1]